MDTVVSANPTSSILHAASGSPPRCCPNALLHSDFTRFLLVVPWVSRDLSRMPGDMVFVPPQAPRAVTASLCPAPHDLGSFEKSG